MGGEKPETQSLTDTAVPSRKMERRTQTQAHGLPARAWHEPRVPSSYSCSLSSSSPSSGSAVSALQWKSEEVSRRKSKGKEKPDQLLGVHSEWSAQMEVDKGQPSASQLLPAGLPPSYKETGWEAVVSTHESELTRRPTFNPVNSVLSPRHEQAKRLLERARSKARSQISDSEYVTRSADREDLELLPIYDSPVPHRPLFIATQEQLAPPPFQLLEVRGRTSVHEAFTQSRGQSPTRVRFEDESEKEAERRYLDRVRGRRPVVGGRSQVSQQPKAGIQGFGAGSIGVGIPVANEGQDSSLEAVGLRENCRRCRTCGSVLAADSSKDSYSKDAFSGGAQSQSQTVPQWVTPGQESPQIIHPGNLGGIALAAGCSLPGSMDPVGVGVAGERVSTFGKLRRRSRTGENRLEASHGPYIRCQELLAQRRNSRTRPGLEDVTGPLSKQMEASPHVTFALNTSQAHPQPKAGIPRSSPGLQLPIKSALKSGSRNKLAGQHAVNQTNGSLGMVPQASQITSVPCLRPSSLRYSSPVLTPELQALIKWEDTDPVDANLPGEEGCNDAPHFPVMRGGAMSKAEDLRAEHRKAELQWDDKRSAERDGKPKLSLRRFFSAMGLNSMGKMVKGSRSSSMEHLPSSPSRHGSASQCSGSPRHTSPGHAPSSPAPKGPLQLQRTPSLQYLHTGSSLAQLRKASSVQSLQSPKRKLERPTMLRELLSPLGLGSRENPREDGEPLDGAAMGRLVQVFPDGTLLLELTRLANGPFGFVISRGKGRPDQGIYVEKVGGSPTENIYTGLLGVGDEILEVNGEKVAGMNLDQVTRVLTRESTVTVRTVPHCWTQH